jgi:hypothetical protein
MKKDFISPGIVLPNISLADEEIAVFGYSVMNGGNPDQASVRAQLETGVKNIVVGAAKSAEATARKLLEKV